MYQRRERNTYLNFGAESQCHQCNKKLCIRKPGADELQNGISVYNHSQIIPNLVQDRRERHVRATISSRELLPDNDGETKATLAEYVGKQ
jgi:hypothetical protein